MAKKKSEETLVSHRRNEALIKSRVSSLLICAQGESCHARAGLSVEVVGIMDSVVIDSLLDFLGGVMYVAVSLLEVVRSWLGMIVRNVIWCDSCMSWMIILTVLRSVRGRVVVRDAVSRQVRAVVYVIIHACVVRTMLVVSALIVVVAHGVAPLSVVPLAVLVFLAIIVTVATLVRVRIR